MIGSFSYLALRLKPDILALVIFLARFQKSPTAYCHQAAKRIIRYLRGARRMPWKYEASNVYLKAYVDSECAGDTKCKNLTSGYLIKRGSALCIWSSEKQPAVALSTCEAEYHSITMASKASLWIKQVPLGAGMEVNNGTPMHSDNQKAMDCVDCEQYPRAMAKNIEVKLHFIWY